MSLLPSETLDAYHAARDQFIAAVEPPRGTWFFLHRWRGHTEVNWGLLRGLSSFWHPREHVFRFGLDELCPTLEQFSAMLGTLHTTPIICPPLVISGARLLQTSFGISERRSRPLISGIRFNFTAVILLFIQRLSDADTHRYHPLLSTLISIFETLFISEPPFIDIGLISIASGMLAGQSPAPLVLGETLNGLDSWVTGGDTFLRGSPWLLYLWALEHFHLISPIPSGSTYSPIRAFRRQIFRADISGVRDWMSWFAITGISELRWIIPWLVITDPVLGLSGTWHVQLRSLRQTSFYFPDRLRRQFGWSQGIPHAPQRFYSVTDLTPRAVTVIERALTDRRPTPQPADAMGSPFPLSDEVLLWLWEDTHASMFDTELGLVWMQGVPSTPENAALVYRDFESRRDARLQRDASWALPSTGLDYYFGEYQQHVVRRSRGGWLDD